MVKKSGANLGEGRALDVLDSSEFLGKFFSHLEGERLLLVLGQLLDRGGVVAQVDLERQEGRQVGGGVWVIETLGIEISVYTEMENWVR